MFRNNLLIYKCIDRPNVLFLFGLIHPINQREMFVHLNILLLLCNANVYLKMNMLLLNNKKIIKNKEFKSKIE